MARHDAEYYRTYRAQKAAEKAVNESFQGLVCGLCAWADATVRWGPYSLPLCEGCLGRASAWQREYESIRDASAKEIDDLWSGPLLVHLFQKGFTSEGALCGAPEPDGPMMLQMTQAGALREWPFCSKCIKGFTDPGLKPNTRYWFGYAIPVVKPTPAEDVVKEMEVGATL